MELRKEKVIMTSGDFHPMMSSSQVVSAPGCTTMATLNKTGITGQRSRGTDSMVSGAVQPQMFGPWEFSIQLSTTMDQVGL